MGGSFEGLPQSEKYQISHGLTSDSDEMFIRNKKVPITLNIGIHYNGARGLLKVVLYKVKNC